MGGGDGVRQECISAVSTLAGTSRRNDVYATSLWLTDVTTMSFRSCVPAGKSLDKICYDYTFLETLSVAHFKKYDDENDSMKVLRHDGYNFLHCLELLKLLHQFLVFQFPS